MMIECNWLLLCLIFLLTVFSKVLHWISVPLSNWLVNLSSPETRELSLLQKEVEDSRAQLSSISQMNDFAEYSRTQRHLHQSESQLHSAEKSRVRLLKKCVMAVQWTCTLLILLVRVVMVLSYRATPVIVLPAHSVWPLGTLLSFPTGVPGGIGIPCWTLTSALTINALTFWCTS